MVCVFARKTSEPLASLVKQIDKKIGESRKLKGFVVISGGEPDKVKDELRKLAKDNQIATDIDNEFWDACKVVGKASKEHVEVFCFYEILPLPAIKKCVVPQKSAVYSSAVPNDRRKPPRHSEIRVRRNDWFQGPVRCPTRLLVVGAGNAPFLPGCWISSSS